MSQWVFTNMFKHAREWRPVSSNNNWANYSMAGAINTVWSTDGYPINYTNSYSSLGYQTELGTDGNYPLGDYIITFEGTGNISLFGDARNVTLVNENRLEFAVSQTTNNGIIIVITKPNVTNIDLRQKKDEFSNDTFSSDYINAVRIFKAIRFSAWMINRPGNMISNSNEDWSTRRPATYYTQVGQNMVSIEYIVELANLLSVDIWLSIPSSANQNFISNLSSYVRDNINNETRIIYIEQSSDKGFNNNNRTLQMQLINTCKSVFGNDTRVKYVLSTWLPAYYENTFAMYTASDLKQFDYYAIAGHVSYGAAYNYDNYDVSIASSLTVDNITSEIRQQIYKDEIGWIYQIQKIALQLNIPLIAYDFGFLVHAPGFSNRFKKTALASNEQSLEDLIIDAIRQPIIQDLYLDVMKRWWKIGGGIMFLRNIVDKINRCTNGGGKCGYQSTLENLLQTPANVPNYKAAIDWLDGKSGNLPFTSDDIPKKVPVNCSDCLWGTCYDGICHCFDGFTGSNCRQLTSKYLDCASDSTLFGMNVGGNDDWSTEVTFTNLHRRARRWIVDQIVLGTAWGQYDQNNITLRDDGYPAYLEIGKTVGTFLTRDLNGHYINGKYICLYDGDGTLDFSFDSQTVIKRDAGRIELQIIHSTDFNNGIFYRIIRTNPSNPIRNVRFFEAALENVYEYFPFHPLFLSLMKKYQTVRFMPWSNIEYDEIVDWTNRTLDSFYTFTLKTGVSLEQQVLLCNTLGTNGWFNLPHKATDDYIRNWALYLRDNLRPDVKIYIEQGNECWGTATNCGKYANLMGALSNIQIIKNTNLYSKELQGRICYHAQIGKHYYDIITSVFGAENRTRLKFVINTQAAWTGPLEVLFLCNGSLYQFYDVVAIAPYLSADLSNRTLITMDEFYNTVIDEAIKNAIRQVSIIASIVNSSSPRMELATYEGGPDFSSLTDTTNTALTELSYKIHRDKRMSLALKNYISNLTNTPGIKLSVYNHFISAGMCSKYGCWGLKESSDAVLEESPKFKAYMDYIDSKRICEWNEKESVCPNNCSSTGVCTVSPFSNKADTCYCYFNYNGTACENFYYEKLEKCTYQCGGKGNCSFDHYQGYYESNLQGFYSVSTCGCKQGYYGYGCGLFDCSFNCNYNGFCVDYNKCSCLRGFKNQFCDVDCGCNGHGECSNTTNECICDQGYKYVSGSCQLDCSVNSTDSQCITCPDCVYGTCVKGSCKCWAGYTLDSRQICTIKSSAPNDGSKLGINLGGVVDWSPQWAFVDLAKAARAWIVQHIDNLDNLYLWSVDEPLNLTSDGYPAEIPYQRQVVTLMLRDVHKTWPDGIYHIFYDGEGVIEFAFDATTIENIDKGRMKIRVQLSEVLNNGVFMKLKKTNPKNPLRNIRVVMDGFQDIYDKIPFHPLFLERLSMFKTIRFMPWTQEEGVVNWSDRRTKYALGKGVALEYMIQLSNILKTNAWLTVPYEASDDFVRQMAILVKANLRKDVKVFLEYTNEAWNSAFNSGKHCIAMGLKLNLSTDAVVARNLYYSKRSVEIIKIWKSVFLNEDDRIIWVLGSFVLMPEMSQRILNYENAYKAHSNVMLAITGYISCGDPTPSQVAVTDLSVLFAGCTTELPNIKNAIQKHASIAKNFSVGLGMYESGSGMMELNAIFTGKTTPGATDKYIAMNRDLRMYQVYKDYYTMYNTFNFTANNHFGFVDRPSIYGSWNLLEYQNQSISDAHRYRALLEIINETRGPVETYNSFYCFGKEFNSTDVCSGTGICIAQDQCKFSSIPYSQSAIKTVPKQGMALTDYFYISTEPWVSDVKLEYAFGIIHPTFGNIQLTDFSSFASAITLLPYTGDVVKIVVFVKNIFGEIYTDVSNDTLTVLKYNGTSVDLASLVSNFTFSQKYIALLDTSQSVNSTADIINSLDFNAYNPLSVLHTFEKITSTLNSQVIINQVGSMLNNYLANITSALKANNFNKNFTVDEVSGIANIAINVNSLGYSDLTEKLISNLAPALIMSGQTINKTSNKLQISISTFDLTNATQQYLNYNDISANLTEVFSNTSLINTGILILKNSVTNESQINVFDELTISFVSGGSILSVSGLANPIVMSFKIYNSTYSYLTDTSLNVSLSCKYYDEQLKSWNTSGCTLAKVDLINRLAYCACNHTTKFSVGVEYNSISAQQSQNNAGIIAGSVIGAVAAVSIIAISGFIIYRQKTKKLVNRRILNEDDSNTPSDGVTTTRPNADSMNFTLSNNNILPMSRQTTKVSMSEIKVQ